MPASLPAKQVYTRAFRPGVPEARSSAAEHFEWVIGCNNQLTYQANSQALLSKLRCKSKASRTAANHTDICCCIGVERLKGPCNKGLLLIRLRRLSFTTVLTAVAGDVTLAPVICTTYGDFM